ncbi:ABC transporter ATP-binding protein [soil metagenome]
MDNIKKLFRILDRWKYNYIFAAILLTLSVLLRLTEPKVLQLAIDKILVFFNSGGKDLIKTNDPVSLFILSFLPEMKIENISYIILSLGLVFLCIALLRGITMFSSSAISSSSTEKAMMNLRNTLFMKMQKLPMSYHAKTSTGELIQRCTGDVETIRKFSSMQLIEILRMSVLFSGAFFMMFSINVNYSLLAVSLAPIIGIGSYIFFKKEMKVWTEHEKSQDKLSIIVQENLSGIRVVKAFAKEQFEIDKFTEQNLEKKAWGMKLVRLNSFMWPFSDMVVYGQISISILAGGYFIFNRIISPGELAAFYSYSMLVTWPLRRIGQIISEMGMTSVAIDRIHSILDTKEEDYTGIKNESNKLEGNIAFENVSFRYTEDGKDVLKGISFEVKKGSKVGLVGPTGSGKTSVINLLMRFFEYNEGSILIDGKELNSYDKRFIRERIGIVLQKPFLFSHSMKDNIAYGDENAGIQKVEQAANDAKIHEIITTEFPDGYNTIIGEKGVNLSGGQKQRTTLARTIITEPDILILDDSTSAVDTETEHQLKAALQKRIKNKTTLIVTHRVNSVKDCDLILVFSKGKIVEKGRHEDLLKTEGFYKKIYDIQTYLDEDIKSDIDSSASEKAILRKSVRESLKEKRKINEAFEKLN